MNWTTFCREGVAEAWWAGPVAWAFARAMATAFPLEGVRQAAGRVHPVVGYLATCVPCLSGQFAIIPAALIWNEIHWAAGIAGWAGTWSVALLLDAVYDRMRQSRSDGGATPKDWPVTCMACGGKLAGLRSSELAVVVTADGIWLSHTPRCPEKA